MKRVIAIDSEGKAVANGARRMYRVRLIEKMKTAIIKIRKDL